MIVNFVCPKCGHDLLAELSQATEFVVVTYAEKSPRGFTVLDYGQSLGLDYDDVAQSYRCANCDETIATDVDELYAWLDEHNMLEEE
jgi:predicted RNA-binding Zn-ribbon protein involved in translation (DUF1610 family)